MKKKKSKNNNGSNNKNNHINKKIYRIINNDILNISMRDVY